MSSYFQTVKRYVRPYSGHIALSVFTNVLAALLNLLTFSLIIPILRVLFGLEDATSEYLSFSSIHSEGVAALTDRIDAVVHNVNYYISKLIHDFGPPKALLILCIYLGVMTFVKVAVTYWSLYALIPVRTGVVRDLRNKLNDKILSSPISLMTEEHKGDLLARISADVADVEYSIVDTLEMIIKNPILIAIYLTALIAISWELTIFVLIVLPIAGYMMGRIGKKLKSDSLEGKNHWGLLMSMVEETLGGLRIIKAFTAEKKLAHRFYHHNERYRHITGNVYKRQQLAHPMSELLGTCAIGAILWYGGTLIISGESSISAPTFIYYILIFYSIINPAKDLSRAAYSVRRGLASMQRIEEVLSLDNPIKDPQVSVPFKFEKEISFNAVSFGYSDEKKVLDNFNFSIKKGETVALVGASGAGKSTIADLIPRFYDVQDGAITIDGVDIRHFAVDELRKNIAYVNQIPILFNDTVFNNIALAPKEVTKEEVVHVAEIANAHNFIEALPNGYDTNIGEQGNKLSGGERQRVSIARALLKNAPILIFDEATSALDNQSERLVQDAVDHLLEVRTTIVIAHRLSTVVKADKIAVIDHGAIVEQGTHEELLKKGGIYSTLYHMQYKESEQ